MGKKAFRVMLLLFGVITMGTVASAQSLEIEPEKAEFEFDMNIGVGLASYEDASGTNRAYQKLSFLPEFSWGKFGAGVDLTFEFDGEFRLRDLDGDGKADGWSSVYDYVYKIDYIRYGLPTEPLYVMAGRYDSYTLAHGLIMDDFSNTLFFPQVRQLGLTYRLDGALFDFPYLGLEGVVDDLLDWDIIGTRLYVRPFSGLDDPALSGIELGASIVTDLDTGEIYDPKNPDYSSYSSPLDYPSGDTVTEIGIDVEVPIIARQKTKLAAYADWALILNRGTGGLAGADFTYRWFTLTGQLRLLGPRFTVSYFGPFYEALRAQKPGELESYDTFALGYLAGTKMVLFDTVRFVFYLSDVPSRGSGPGISTGLYSVEGALGKLDAGIRYDRRNIKSFSDLTSGDDTFLKIMVGYRISRSARIVLTYQRAYGPSGECQDKTFCETQFSF
ncbi:MAG: hypothetical protein JXQ30_01445 [Spirochaetes bacterium]|nr:hypothetical protein [Spirochaetota bacterium]